MIFEDPSHRRWRRALVVFALLVVAAMAAFAITVTSVMVPPRVADPFSGKPEVQAKAVQSSLDRLERPVLRATEQKRMDSLRADERKRFGRVVGDAKSVAVPLPAGATVGFVTEDDPGSIASLERHIGSLDAVIPDWFELPGPGCDLTEHIDEKTQHLLERSGALVLPRVANVAGEQWRGAETSRLLANDTERACLAKKLTARLAAIGAAGVNLDLEELQPEDSENFLELIVLLRASLHAKGMRLTVDVPFHDPAFDFEFIGDVADAVMVMAYDEHYPSSPPGAIASREWLDDSFDEVLPRLPADRVVVVLGGYGYDWNVSEPNRRAEDLSFRSTMDLARAAGATPVFEEDVEDGHFAYQAQSGETHEVWFQDALATWNQIGRLSERRVSRIGLWRLGTEDESVWKYLGADAHPKEPSFLSSVPPIKSVGLFGDGEVFTLRGKPQLGERELVTDAAGRIMSASYRRVPSGLVVERHGGSGKQVVLTFDDGPDERNTARLLDVLHELRAPATFFVVGDQVMRAPGLVEREAAEGHLIGNHSFSHSHMQALTPKEAASELAGTQRLIEGLTGKRSPLFRAPYTATIDPDSPDDLSILRMALDNGYLFVGGNVDADDWEAKTTEEIVRTVVTGVTSGEGRIVVMHDGGGDRSKTIAAVREIVPELRRRGYEVVSLDRLLGVRREEVAVPLATGERLLSETDAFMAYARSWGFVALTVLFFLCTVLSIFRILFLGGLTLKNLKSGGPKSEPGFAPLVTVVVPAFNESKVIRRTLSAILASDYGNLEVLVVDDGSTDDTAAVVRGLASRDPRVHLIQQTNGGKASAANRALAASRGEIVVAVDADTIVLGDAISKMVAHFVSDTVTAVCGNIEVGNVNGVVTTFQAIEYVTSQNFDRRAYSVLNCISVVPGALGAWRRDAVLAAGGYSDQTLTEDADLTLTMLRGGGRVVYEPEAHGMTEAPESLSALLRQRFRWTYGTYQCLWKHRAAFFRGTLGWVGLPNMAIFQVVFPLLSPIGDIMMVLSIFRGEWRAFLAGYLAFLVMDICGSVLAFTLDHKPLKWLPLLLVQRFSYRQIMYYVCFKAMIAAVRGARHGWRKLDRTGSVRNADLQAVSINAA